MSSNDNYVLNKVKRVLPDIIYHNIQFSKSKREYYRIAASIDPILAPDVAPGDMSSRINYLRDIFKNYSKEQFLTFVSILIKEDYDAIKRFAESGYEKTDEFKKNHEKLVNEINKAISHIDAEIYLDGKIEFSVDEPVKQKVYRPLETYEFYKDLKNLIKNAKQELFISDGYVDEELLELYVDKVPSSVNIRILTNKPQGNFLTVAKKFSQKPNTKFEVRKTENVHDRVIFVDDSCYVFGQSIKDAAKQKPTYIIKLDIKEIFTLCKKAYEELWNRASTIQLN